ncbi:FAD-dependent monooxygenase [Streptomyces sp. NPDC050844]|uniref:FAD-dependent monooxygenase n=1 Tax=Streptomyces sp. NPDC050844 TaxID=3155790 RepID=UPI0033F98B96
METDVLIVGAGPAGLALANVLAECGVRCRIVDAAGGPVRESRAGLIHTRTLELLDRIGVAAPMIESGRKITHVEMFERGRRAGGFPLAGRGIEGRTPFPYALALEQYRTEQLLVDALTERGAAVDWDTEFVRFTDPARPRTAVLRRCSGAEFEVSARWTAAADGAGSAVRRSLGLGFTGRTFGQTGLLADVETDFAGAGRPAEGRLRLNLARGGFVGMLGMSGDRYRFFGAVPRGFAPAPDGPHAPHSAYAAVGDETLQRWFDEYFSVDATLRTVEWTALFRLHSRIAERFGSGPVHLVGDAAHIHSPAGGQGLNLAIGDAFNLGWKLAQVAGGHAGERLLDSYDAERRPVARQVLRGTDRGFALETVDHGIAVWFRTHLAPLLIRPLSRLRPVRHGIFRLFAQTWIGYRRSPAVAAARRRVGRGPRPGDRIPYGAFRPASGGGGAQGVRYSLLISEGRRPDPAFDGRLRAVRDLLGRYPVPVDVHVVRAGERPPPGWGAAGRRARVSLVRPDGHLCYTGAPDGLGALRACLEGPCAWLPRPEG